MAESNPVVAGAEALPQSSDFPIAEVPGQLATAEQKSMFYTRYRFARDFCAGKQVVEVACGGGQGLGYLAQVAASVTGGDIDEMVLQYPRSRYQGRSNIAVRQMDAHQLPFADDSVDVVLLFDAIYWLTRPDVFVCESRRVLRKGGTLLISTVNRYWPEFNPSPYSTRYLSATELYELLAAQSFSVTMLGGFSTEPKNTQEYAINLLKRTAARLRLIPSTIEGKERLKRIFFGKLEALPQEVSDGMAVYEQLQEIDAMQPNAGYKMIYAIAKIQK